MWQCKDCGAEVSRRSERLKHYRLKHSHFGRGHHIKCIYPDCPCIFKTWNSLLTHLSRNYSNTLKHSDIFTTFSCHLCGCSELATERDYFVHISNHLKNNETVCLKAVNTNPMYKSHKSRKHSLHSLFTDGHILNKVLDSSLISEETGREVIYRSFRDGCFSRKTVFYQEVSCECY